MIHTWAPPLSTEVLKGETFSNLRIANFKPESVSLSPICTHAEQCWKEYLNQFCCSHWGSSSSAKSKKDPGSLLPGGNDYYSVLCCPLLWLVRCPKSGADLDIPVPSHPFFLGGWRDREMENDINSPLLEMEVCGFFAVAVVLKYYQVLSSLVNRLL